MDDEQMNGKELTKVAMEHAKLFYGKYIDGNKTKSLVYAIIVLAALQGLNLFVLPAYIWKVVGAVALWALRDGVKKTEVAVKSATEQKSE